MNIPQILNGIKKILSLVPFLLAACLGGLVSGMVVKGCTKTEPVQVAINLNPYENELQRLRTKQDSIRTVLPTYGDALRELSERYGTDKPN